MYRAVDDYKDMIRVKNRDTGDEVLLQKRPVDYSDMSAIDCKDAEVHNQKLEIAQREHMLEEEA